MTTRWTPQEDNRLLFYVGQEPPCSIAARLGRTERSVIVRFRRDHGKVFTSAAARMGGMSITACAQAMGVARPRVFDWIRYGWLTARKRYVIRDYIYTVSDEELTRFIRTIGGLHPKLQPAPEWADIVEQARLDLRARYVDRAELADAFGLTPQRVLSLVGFPAPALPLPRYWYDRAVVKAWLETAPPRYRTPRALRAFGLEDHHGEPKGNTRHE